MVRAEKVNKNLDPEMRNLDFGLIASALSVVL